MTQIKNVSRLPPLTPQPSIRVSSPTTLAPFGGFPKLPAFSSQTSLHATPLDSVIVTNFPQLFADFHATRFALLWRGSRDGFGCREFHRLCDQHQNTLTIVLDTAGNIFGGFTPLKWKPTGGYDCDHSLAGFLFSLRSPTGLPPKKFPLKPERQQNAIFCDSQIGPAFGGGPADLCVANQSNVNANSFTHGFGSVYENDTGLNGATFFTGNPYFTVKEIEVFHVKTKKKPGMS
jgi:hypothetical protein